MMSWNDNTCSHLAESFKEMAMQRAKTAKLRGYEKFCQAKSQSRMLEPNATKAFLKELKISMTPQVDTFMEECLEQKLMDMEFPRLFAELRHDLSASGNTIWDFQRTFEKYQLHQGEVLYYSQLRKSSARSNSDEITKLWEYFPLHSTVYGTLKALSHVFGMHFLEILPTDHKEHFAKLVSEYEARDWGKTHTLDKHHPLRIFQVSETSQQRSHPFGYLVLNVLERAR